MQDFPCLGIKKNDAKLKKEMNSEEDREALPGFAYRLQPDLCCLHTICLCQRQKSSHCFLFVSILLFTNNTEHLSCVTIFSQPQEREDTHGFSVGTSDQG